MGQKFPNPRLFKVNWNYTVADAVRCAKVHENTIRNWIKWGLKPIDNNRPMLITGAEFIRFLTQQRAARKRPCQPHELYCLRCRKPQRPAGDMADYLYTAPNRGCLTAICPGCDGMLNKRMSPSDLPAVKAILNISEQRHEPHIDDRSTPSLNCNFERKR